MKATVLYTMFSGLGDFILMHNVKKMAERALGFRVYVAHRRNKYIKCLSPGEKKDFFDIYSPLDMLSLIRKLRHIEKKEKRFGIQQAPGSLQGYSLLFFLKKCSALDLIVDFNLINADLRTPVAESYAFDMHKKQLEKLFGKKIDFTPELPFKTMEIELPKGYPLVALNPLSGRAGCNTYTWPYYKWKDLIEGILGEWENTHFLLILTRNRGRIYLELREIAPSRIHIYSNLTLGQLAGLVERSDILISVNSGPVHIGHILRKKTVILSGPTIDLWNPTGSHIRVIRDKTARFYPSEQCFKAPGVPAVHNICVEDVLKAFSELIGERAMQKA